MGSFTNRVTIDRPADEVFAFVANFENVPAWNYAIVETRKTSPGPVAVGTTYVQRREIPSPSEEAFTVTELAEGRSVAIEGTLGPFPARLRYEVEPAGSGTQLTNDVELVMSGPARLLGGLATSKVRAAIAKNLQVLKRRLESGA